MELLTAVTYLVNLIPLIFSLRAYPYRLFNDTEIYYWVRHYATTLKNFSTRYLALMDTFPEATDPMIPGYTFANTFM